MRAAHRVWFGWIPLQGDIRKPLRLGRLLLFFSFRPSTPNILSKLRKDVTCRAR